ncbi:SH3 domain-containing protein [Oribacterium sp. WCC10]|uniref:SH3 domain-containing protein n=1 Tax=Oribacterium sp. WCC10 TaxID=1855343 RepID=UPI0008E0EB23|nr:SH3 domain-containing protein [Oribacterium sp. WCC10]SFG57515.1 Cadherin-like beta sandwich domain-containing protein [Oribacterium sp. WCC10]
MKKSAMKRQLYKTGALLSAFSIFMSSPAASYFNQTAIVYADSASVIHGTNVNVRSSAGTDGSVVTALGNNTAVTVLNQTTGSDGKTWYYISFFGGTGYVRSDFVSAQATYSTDASFEAYLAQQGFPESYKSGLRQLHAQYPNWVFTAVNTGLDWSTVIQAELQGTNSLIEKSVKSSWKSTDPGKFDWTTSSWPGFDGATWVAASKEILEYYMDPRNFLDADYVFQFTAHKYDPSRQTIEGLKSMIKGTFLEGSVAIDSSSPLYQSALQSAYAGMTTGTSADTSTTVVNSIADLVGSGMSSDEVVINYDAPTVSDAATTDTSTSESSTGVIEVTDATTSDTSVSSNSTTGPTVGSYVNAGDGTTAGPTGTANTSVSTDTSTAANSTAAVYGSTVTVPYADIIMEAAQITQVNPYVLASMIIQEQGTKGTSGSISGASGYYNFFNVGAYATGGMTAVERGIWYASQNGSYNRPWNSQERAIIGGAMFYAENYVNAGQNTLYLKKFNVQGSNMFKHQYMTNTQGAAEEGKKLGKAYNATMRNDAIEFFIPVYNNMPESPCVMPTKDGNPNNKLSSLSLDGFTITPGFNMDTESYTLIVDPSVSYVNVSATAIHQKATVNGTGQIPLYQASTVIPVTVTAENGDQRTYQITVNKAAGGQLNAYQAQTATQNVSSDTVITGTQSIDSLGQSVSVTVQADGNNGTVSATDAAITSNMVEVVAGPL